MKIKRSGPLQSARNLPADGVSDRERVYLFKLRERENVIVARSPEKSGGSPSLSLCLSLSNSLFRCGAGGGHFPREYNRRNGRLLRTDVSAESFGRMQGTRRNTPGGRPSTFPPSLVLFLSLYPFSPLVYRPRYIILLTICPKVVEAAAFPRGHEPMRKDGSDSYLFPSGYVPLRPI